MDVSCDIIRDLLPLYAEDLVSDATRELVDGHLCGCDGCTKELGSLKKGTKLPLDVEVNSLKRVEQTIRKKKILTVICVVMTIVSLVWSSMLFMTSPIYLTADQAIEGVELREDGGLAIDRAEGYTGTGSFDIGERDMVCYVTSSRYDWLRGRRATAEIKGLSEDELTAYIQESMHLTKVTQRDRDRFNLVHIYYNFRNPEGKHFTDTNSELSEATLYWLGDDNYTRADHDYDLWYLAADGTVEKLLWNGGDGELPEGGPWSQGRAMNDLRNQYLLLIFCCLGAAVVSFVCARFLKNKEAREAAVTVGIVFSSVVAHFLIVSGLDFVDAEGSRCINWNNNLLFTTLLLAATGLLWRRLYVLNHREG